MSHAASRLSRAHAILGNYGGYFEPRTACAISPYRRCQQYSSSTEHLPRVAQPSVWNSLIPKAFRASKTAYTSTTSQCSKEWNPATFFICIFLLIGSNAIQMLTLRNEHLSFSRKADQKIALLKEVLEKIKRGEKVDVEKVLGTGDEEQEREWDNGKPDANFFGLYPSLMQK